MNTVEELRHGLAGILEEDPGALLLGEDILDPYGGAFKVTKGLSTRFPDRVVQTPISENGFMGVATGLAYVGFRPIVEIMFGDFVTLIVDPLLNTATKLDWLSRGRMAGDLLVRAPMGGRRGYGPIHSQTLERLFLGWPGLALFAPSLLSSPGALLRAAFAHPAKVKLFVENKVDYAEEPWSREELARRGFTLEARGDRALPLLVASNAEGEAPDLVFCVYGGMARHALDAAYELLIEDEATSTVLVPSQICPLEGRALAEISREAARAGRLVCGEEGYAAGGWGSYLLSALAGAGCPLPLAAVRLVGAAPEPIPANPEWERRHLPGVEHLVRAAREVL